MRTSEQSSPNVTRRRFLQAAGLALAYRYRAWAAGFTAIGDDLVWLLRWCAYGGATRFASAG